MLESVAAFIGVLSAGWVGQDLTADSLGHPLDPLTAAEYSAVIAVLHEANYVDIDALYPLITLQEPAKATVLDWQPREPVPRQAFVIVKVGPQTFEGVVDVSRRSVVSWREVLGVEPGFLMSDEWLDAQRIALGNRALLDALSKRGITSLRDVVCVPNTVGYYGIPEEEGRRLVKVVCYGTSGIRNFWGRPLEGLIALVDYHQGEVVRIIDTGVVPTTIGLSAACSRLVAALNRLTLMPPRLVTQPSSAGARGTTRKTARSTNVMARIIT